MNSEIRFSNGMVLHLDLDGDRFRGIGKVTCGERLLRSGQLPWIFSTESEDAERAVRFEDFVLEEVRHTGDEASLVLRSQGRAMSRAQEADAMGEARIKARRTKQPEAAFIWTFRAITEQLFENTWRGLEMQIHFQSRDARIHWVLEQATWEIGGAADGVTLIQQDVSSIDLEKRVQTGDSLSTIEKFFTEGWGGSYPMDMLPRAAGSAICDFQAHEDVALCLFSETPGLTRARLEKFADEEIIHYLDRAYFPLSNNVSVQPRKLLVHIADQALKPHEIRNLWLDCFTEVRARIHAGYGFKLEIPEPCTGGILWDRELKELMDRWPDRLERDMPEYARLGYKQAFIHGVWDSITSDPNPPGTGNMCCPYSFTFAEVFGGPERMRQLNDAACAEGLRLMQWFSFHLSKFSPTWKEHPDWVLKEANGDPWDGNYHSLWSGRMRSGYGEVFRQQILDVMDTTGIAGIFWDSHQNLGVTCIDWGAPDKAPQADEIFRLQTELQRKGFQQRVEVITIFGVSAVAIFGFENDKFRRRLWDDFVQGDHAFALMDCSPGFFTGGENHLTDDRLSPERYFWLVAHRAVPSISAHPWAGDAPEERLPGGKLADDYARVNHLYNTAFPHMHRLRVQPDGTHVVWLDEAGAPSVVWVFRDTEFACAGTVVDIESGARFEAGETAQLQAGKVYGLQENVSHVTSAL